MKRFVFSMQTLLEARMAFEEAAERKLAEGLRILQEAHDELIRIIALLEQEASLAAGLGGRYTSRNELLAHERYRHALDQMRCRQLQVVQRSEAAVVELRESLRVAMAERQILENLKKKEYIKWACDARRQEQKDLDELALQRFLRRPEQTAPIR